MSPLHRALLATHADAPRLVSRDLKIIAGAHEAQETPDAPLVRLQARALRVHGLDGTLRYLDPAAAREALELYPDLGVARRVPAGRSAGLSVNLLVRVSPTTRAKIDAAAAEAGVERSAWVRGVVERALRT